MKLLIHNNIPSQIADILSNVDGVELVALPSERNEKLTIKSYIELAVLNNAIFITKYIGFREIIMSSFNLKPNVLQVKFESSDYSMVGAKILTALNYVGTVLQSGVMVSLHLFFRGCCHSKSACSV
jgi:predicted nuclease of predicted toxin-antitoxin system